MDKWQEYVPELLTDLYELTMAASYFEEGMHGEATFSLFIRDYPPNRAYFVSAGLEHLKELICNLHFSDSSLSYLESTGRFSKAFLNYLRNFRFTGTVRGIPEGRIFFPQEPLLEVTAPLIEAQLLETLVLNVMQLETLIATKAARCVQAAQGRDLIDFSLRRTHGVDAGVKVARASYVAGFRGTSNLLAGKIYGIPVFGTMAHSYVTSFRSEIESFWAFARAFPENTVLLIDTYDTLTGAKKALIVAERLAREGKKLRGVRLDSGDLVELSRQVKKIFVDAGHKDVQIMVSGSLDEFRLQELLHAGAAIDVFAVGTRMGVSADVPYFDIVYKMVEYDGKPVLKLSSGKKTWTGKKQVFRYYDEKGNMDHDVLGLYEDDRPDAEKMMHIVIQNGRTIWPNEPLDLIRKRFAEEFSKLPLNYRELNPTQHYPVEISKALMQLQEEVTREKVAEEIQS